MDKRIIKLMSGGECVVYKSTNAAYPIRLEEYAVNGTLNAVVYLTEDEAVKLLNAISEFTTEKT